MFILDSWNSPFRLVFWMAPPRRSEGGKSRFGGGGGDAGGKPPEFEQVYKDHFGAVLAFLLRKGFSEEDARDLTQETFIRVYQSIGTFRAESSLRTWIFSIAANLGRNDVRSLQTEKRKGTKVSLEDGVENGLPLGERLAGSEPGSLDRLLADEGKRELHKAIQRMPPQMRRCILLYVQGLKYREIAAVMKIAIGTVKAQISQAKDRLKKELGPYFDAMDWRDDGE